MNDQEIIEWIRSFYGEPTVQSGGGVVVVAVSVYGGVAVGMGSDFTHAYRDLYLDLHAGEDVRGKVPTPPTPWEIERREMRAKARAN